MIKKQNGMTTLKVSGFAALLAATTTFGTMPNAHALTSFSQNAFSSSSNTVIEPAGFGRSIGLRRAITRAIVDGRNGYTTSVVGNNQVRVKTPRELRAEKAAEEKKTAEKAKKQGVQARSFKTRPLDKKNKKSGFGYGVGK